jgi:hypothetical protein
MPSAASPLCKKRQNRKFSSNFLGGPICDASATLYQGIIKQYQAKCLENFATERVRISVDSSSQLLICIVASPKNEAAKPVDKATPKGKRKGTIADLN